MKQTPRNSKLFQYLAELGLIGSTDTEAIKKAKAAYRKKYLLQAKRRQRLSKVSVTIQFTKEEFESLHNRSKQYGIKYPQLIKEIIQAYFAERSIVIQPHIILEIRSLYFKIIRTLEALNKKGGFRIFSSIDMDTAIAELHRFQKEVKELLENPHHNKS